jgi:hypothetical protein
VRTDRRDGQRRLHAGLNIPCSKELESFAQQINHDVRQSMSWSPSTSTKVFTGVQSPFILQHPENKVDRYPLATGSQKLSTYNGHQMTEQDPASRHPSIDRR